MNDCVVNFHCPEASGVQQYNVVLALISPLVS